LTLHRGNVSEVARALGKARMQIQRWMKRWQIDASTFRG
jgi:transposase-like protein